jgi:hypothetical protein
MKSLEAPVVTFSWPKITSSEPCKPYVAQSASLCTISETDGEEIKKKFA